MADAKKNTDMTPLEIAPGDKVTPAEADTNQSTEERAAYNGDDGLAALRAASSGFSPIDAVDPLDLSRLPRFLKPGARIPESVEFYWGSSNPADSESWVSEGWTPATEQYCPYFDFTKGEKTPAANRMGGLHVGDVMLLVRLKEKGEEVRKYLRAQAASRRATIISRAEGDLGKHGVDVVENKGAQRMVGVGESGELTVTVSP